MKIANAFDVLPKRIVKEMQKYAPDSYVYISPEVVLKYEHTLSSARSFARAGQLEEWLHIYLLFEGQDEKLSGELTDIQRRAFEIIFANLSERVSDNVSLDIDFNNIDFDSITFRQTVAALETEFGLKFDDKTNFPTVKSLIEYVGSKVQ